MDSDNTNAAPLSSIEADRLAATRMGSETRPISDYDGAAARYVGGVTRPDKRWDENNYVPRQRPTGVTVIAVLNFVSAALTGLIFLLALGANVELGVWGLIVPLQTIIAIVVGVGLLQLKSWARTLAFFVYGFNIVINALSLLIGPVEGSTLLGIGIAGIIIWYLRQPQVAEVFE